MSRPDWKKIQAAYVTGAISYRDLAEREGVSFSTLSARSKREKWAENRRRYRMERSIKTAELMAEQAAEDAVDKMAKLRRAADGISEVIEGLLSDTETLRLRVINGDRIDTTALKNLTMTLKNTVEIVRSVYDLPTLQEREAMDIAAQRLALDKARAEAGHPEDDETGVIEIAPVVEADDA